MITIEEFLKLIDDHRRENLDQDPAEILQALIKYMLPKRNTANFFEKKQELFDPTLLILGWCLNNSLSTIFKNGINRNLTVSDLDGNSDWHNLFIAFFARFPEHFNLLDCQLQSALFPSLTAQEYQCLITDHQFYTTYPDVAEGMVAIFPYDKKLEFCQSLTHDFCKIPKTLKKSKDNIDQKYNSGRYSDYHKAGEVAKQGFLHTLHHEHKNQNILGKHRNINMFGWEQTKIPDKVYSIAFKDLKNNDKEDLINQLTAQDITEDVCHLLVHLLPDIPASKQSITIPLIADYLYNSKDSNFIMSIIDRFEKSIISFPKNNALLLFRTLLGKFADDKLSWNIQRCLFLIKLASEIPAAYCRSALNYIDTVIVHLETKESKPDDPSESPYPLLSQIAYELIIRLNANDRTETLALMIKHIKDKTRYAHYAGCLLTRSYFLLTKEQQSICSKLPAHDNFLLLNEFFRLETMPQSELDKLFPSSEEEPACLRWMKAKDKRIKYGNNNIVIQVINDFLQRNNEPQQALIAAKLEPLLARSPICRRAMTLLLPQTEEKNQSSIDLSLLKNIEHCESINEVNEVFDAITRIKIKNYEEIVNYCCQTLIFLDDDIVPLRYSLFHDIFFNWLAKIIPAVFETSPQALSQLAITLYQFIKKETPILKKGEKQLDLKLWKAICATLSTLIPFLECRPHSDSDCKREAPLGIYRDDFIILILNQEWTWLNYDAMYFDLLYSLRSSIPNSLNRELGNICYFALRGRTIFWEYSRSYHGLIAEAIKRNIPIVPYDSTSNLKSNTLGHPSNVPNNHWDIALLLLNNLIKKENDHSYYEPGCLNEIIQLFGNLSSRMNHSEAIKRMIQLKALAASEYKTNNNGEYLRTRPVNKWVIYYLIENLSRHIKDLTEALSAVLPSACVGIVRSYTTVETDFSPDPKYAARIEPFYPKN